MYFCVINQLIMSFNKALNSRFFLFTTAFVISQVLSSCEPTSQTSVSAVKALGLQSAIIVETADFSALKHAVESNAWYEHFDTDADWVKLNHSLYPLFQPLNNLNDFLSSRRFFAGLELIGKGTYGWVISTELTEDYWTKFKEDSALSSDFYDDFEFKFINIDESKMYFGWAKGVLVISMHRVLLESGLRRLYSEHTLDKDPVFEQIRGTTSQRDHVNLYVQYSELGGWLTSFLRTSFPEFATNFSQWTALDLRISPNNILLSGLSNLGDSTSFYLDVFRGIKPQRISSESIVPTSAALWMNFSVGNFMTYYRQFDKYRAVHGKKRNIDQVLMKYEIDFDNCFLRWLDREYGLIWMGSSQSGKEKMVAYFEVRSEKDFWTAHLPLVDTTSLQVFRGEKIYKTTHYGWLSPLLGKAFDKFKANYVWLYQNRIFYAANEDIITDFINDVLDNRTLSNSTSYKKFSSQIPDRASIQVVFMPGAEMLTDIMPKSMHSFIKRQNDMREHSPFVSLQYLVQDKMAYTGVYTSYQSEVESVVKPIWSVDVPGKIVAGPFLLKNHLNNQKEIAVQDENHVLYYYSTSGVLLWKRKLNGRIIGDIEQVDLYRNAKLQMAFSTEQEIVIFDRNGAPVAPFPKKTPEAITSPIAVFDYDKTRNYRFVFACGTTIYNWDKEAKNVQGWELTKLSGVMTRKAQHVVAGSKDYLVFISDDGKAHLTDRRGVLRVPSVLDLPSDNSSEYIVQVDSELKTIKLTALTNDSKLRSILSNSKIDEVKPGGLPDLANMVIEGETMIIFAGQTCLIKDPVFPFKVQIQDNITGHPKVFGDAEQRVLSFASQNDQIYVFNNKGQLVPGFPVYGTSNFALGRLYAGPSKYLITTTPENKILVYLIQ
jgi:hypothetical protein